MSTHQQQAAYIWTDLHQELQRFITARVGAGPAAEDLLQDVFVRIHLHLHQLKDPTRLTSWVYQICRNVIADHCRRKPFASLPEELHLPETAAEDDLYNSLSNCINGKIAQLPAQDREAILLTYFQQYSQKQLADFLGLSYSGTKNRIQRTRDKLRQAILDCEKVESDASGRITGLAH